VLLSRHPLLRHFTILAPEQVPSLNPLLLCILSRRICEFHSITSPSLPVSRRNSNTEILRVGQDLSVIYENAPDKYPIHLELSNNNSQIYSSDHRKSSGTLSGTWSSTSPEATYVPSTHGYDEAVEQRNDSISSSKHVFGMLKTEDGQFPYLSNLAESVSLSAFL
jgi:hypothetical protein